MKFNKINIKSEDLDILRGKILRNGKTSQLINIPVKTKKKRNHPESDLQRACITEFDRIYPIYRKRRMKLDNENKCSKFVGEMKRQAGLLEGAADLFFAIPKKKEIGGIIIVLKCGLFCECKYGSGKQTPKQIEFQLAVDAAGYAYILINSVETFLKEIKSYFNE